MQGKLNEREHDVFHAAIKAVVYYSTRRILTDEERRLVDWMLYHTPAKAK